MSTTKTKDRTVIIGIAIITLISFVYSVLIAGRPLVGLGIAILLSMLYFVWRFIRAIERIAEAVEQ